jgi:hypothetical protein
MATKPVNDDFDLPDMHIEPDPPPKVIVQAEDLHLGVPVVQTFVKSWVEQYGPKPPGPGMRAMDFLILAMFFGTVVLFIRACSWAFFS